MRVDVLHGPANAAAKVSLDPGEALTAEAGAMIAMSGGVAIETTTSLSKGGGLLDAVKRVLGGESYFLNRFTAGRGGGEVWLAPTLPGDVLALDRAADEAPLIVQGGSYLASGRGVTVDAGWQGLTGLLAGERALWLEVKGAGFILLNAFGALYTVDVDGAYVVDLGHVAAFPATLGFALGKAANGWISSALSGEGLVCRFEGRGRLHCQSHSARAFGRRFGPLLRPREA